jgi:uncharacterized protein (TIGR03032 family)
MAVDILSSPNQAGQSPSRDVEYRFSSDLVDLLARLDCSVIISTYQAGQLVTLGSHAGELVVDFQAFDRPMGLAYRPGSLAVATRQQVWFLSEHNDIAKQIEPVGRYKRLLWPRQSCWTGDIQAHEVGWRGDQLWLVNTTFSCLCTLHSEFSFVPQWRPPFISGLASEDRCHLNGLALADGEPMFVTALSESDTAAGWRPSKLNSGVVLTVPEGEVALDGLCMPHSPRIYRGDLWVLNSGRGQLLRVDPEGHSAEVVAQLPGYTRGLSFCERYAFIGLSKVRETAVFGGVPIADRPADLKCGMAIVDITTGQLAGRFEFTAGVEEIFDLVVIPNSSATVLNGPSPGPEEQTLWIVPTPDQQREMIPTL